MILNMNGGGGSYKAFLSVSGDAEAMVSVALKATGKIMARGAIGSDGTLTLAVRQGGTYTVTATDGTQTKSMDVTIVESGETYRVSVVFDLTVFPQNTGGDAISGGWRADTNSAKNITVSDGIMTIKSNAITTTANIIDFSRFDELRMTVKSINKQDSSNRISVGITKSNDKDTITASGSASTIFSVYAGSANMPTSGGEIVVSLKDENGNPVVGGAGLIAVLAYQGSSGQYSAEISDIRLAASDGETADLKSMAELVEMIYENDMEVIG